MNNKKFILTAKFLNAGKRDSDSTLFFSGTAEEAREKARRIQGNLLSMGYKNVRVEIWEVIATSYKGTVRG